MTENNRITTDPDLRRLWLTKGVSLFFAVATAVGLLFRLMVAPLAMPIVIVDCVCILGFVLAHLLARRGKRKQAGIVTLLAMGLLVLITGYFAGALDAPIISVTPLIPLTACLLISARAGMVCALLVGATLITYLIAGTSGWPIPESPLNANEARTMRTVTLTLTCVLAAATVWHYERIQAQLQSLAIHDALTGIFNRGAFDLQLQHEHKRSSRSGEPLSLLLFDVDKFKAFNDQNGHQAGDVCLQSIATSVTQRMRRASDFFARYGGEEFVVLLPDTNLEDSAKLAELLRQRITDLQIAHKTSPSGVVTVSIGVATATNCHSHSPSRLLATADTALYEAKESGRNRVIARQI